MGDPQTRSGGEQVHADDERWYLNDQRDFLRRSIDDARAEHEAGDLTDRDFSLLMARDEHKLTEVESDLARLGPLVEPSDAPDTTPDPASAPAPATGAAPRSRWRLVGIVASSALIILGVAILLVHALNPRLPGQASSGSITQSQAQLIEQQLNQAATLNNHGQVANALSLYEKVLAEDPGNPNAIAASGWLEWNAGATKGSRSLMSLGRVTEEKAIRLEPTYYAGHLFLGLILLNQDDNAPGAAAQFTQFLADGPPASEVQEVAPQIKGAYTKAGLPVPAALTTPG